MSCKRRNGSLPRNIAQIGPSCRKENIFGYQGNRREKEYWKFSPIAYRTNKVNGETHPDYPVMLQTLKTSTNFMFHWKSRLRRHTASWRRSLNWLLVVNKEFYSIRWLLVRTGLFACRCIRFGTLKITGTKLNLRLFMIVVSSFPFWYDL